MCVVVQNKVAAPWIISRGRQSLRTCCTPGLPVRASATRAQAQHSMEVDLIHGSTWLHNIGKLDCNTTWTPGKAPRRSSLASSSDGSPLGLSLTGLWCHPCNSGDGGRVEQGERPTQQAALIWSYTVTVVIHICSSTLVDCPWARCQGVQRPSMRLGDALAAHRLFVLCMPA